MILKFELTRVDKTGVLHVCGGDPLEERLSDSAITCSPRMWR